MEAALVRASTGVMKPLLSKLTKLLEHEYVKVKGLHKKIRFLRDEMSAMSATLQMLADVEQLNPEMRDWRDNLRELAYNLEDCVDAFMVHVDNERDVPSGFIKRFVRKLKKLKARHEIANQIEELKACAIEASDRHKRYLVVFDDVWDAKIWATIKLSLVNENCGSRVITTTRSIAVARCLSSQGNNVYQMKPLSFDDSRRLFFKRAFGSENISFTHLGSIPDEIIRKCDGLPLAIIAISSMLADQHAKSEWDRVLNDIGSALAKNPGAENMTTILSMSYFDIPYHQRTCLLYLSVFPEDYVIEKQCLINRWIAEGFIQEVQGRTKYEIGDGYFNDFINRCMIQPIDVKFGEAEACRVHDIILDYIKCKAVEENFITSLDSSEHAYTSEYKIRRLCVNNRNEEHVTLWASAVLSHVRSVTIFGQPLQTSLLPSTALRLLDLGDCNGMSDHHLSSMEKLVHLKYLRVCSRSITELPGKIGELHYLQTLDVRGTRIKELPPGITKLQRLAHLYVDCDITFPDGMIGRMLSLEELRTYGVQSYKQQKSLQEFSKLTKLRTLEIRWNLNIPDGLEGMIQVMVIYIYLGTLLFSCNLHNLYIMDFPGGYPLWLDLWHPPTPCSLRKLCFQRWAIHKVPSWMGCFENLGVLELMIIRVGPEDVEILGAIPSLLFLKLSTARGTNGRIIIHPSNGFRCLKYFSICIYACGTSLEFEVGSMPKVEHVNLEFAVHKMECQNGASNLGIHHLSSLGKFEVTICNNYVCHDLAEDEDDDTVRCVASVINDIETLPSYCVVNFQQPFADECEHFVRSWRECIKRTEWLMEQLAAGETEQENKEEENEQTDEKEMEQQEDYGGSN
ncbi:unnamed protein product [Urochloa decumbens]|uniref:Uncharacterized protein n=1 Tax=Urochloa decumbens TaxID=240449 RepID=A0ABC9AV28_9POAL